MTENEAIAQIEERLEYWDKHSKYLGGIEDYLEAMRTAVEALKEIQQYRSIGTLEECKDFRAKIEILKKIFPLLQDDPVRPTWNLSNFEEFCNSLKNMIEECRGNAEKQKPIKQKNQERMESTGTVLHVLHVVRKLEMLYHRKNIAVNAVKNWIGQRWSGEDFSQH